MFRGRSKLSFYFQPPEVPNETPALLPECIDWRVGFQDLPNEIILYILDALEEDEQVFQFAFLSRTLHHLSLQLYLSRKGFGSHPGGQLSLFNYNAWDCIKALRVALFQPSLKKLYYAIDCKRTPGELSREFRVVEQVLGKLEEVKEVVLSFQDVPNPGPLPSLVLGPSYFGSRPEDLLLREHTAIYGLTPGLCRQLTAVVDSLVVGGKCSSISLGNCFLYAPSSEEIVAVMAHYLGGTCWFSGLASRLQAFRKPTQRLETFKLHSRMAFHPGLCRWTIDTLNNSSLTTLSIAHHYMIYNAAWSLILPCISIPTLLSLAFDCSSISHGDLLLFLRRHSGLRSLYLGRHVTSPVTDLPTQNISLFGSRCILKELTHLVAPPSWIAYFLSPKGSLPSLQNVKILLHFLDSRHFTLLTLDETLEPVVQRLSEMAHLHLALTFGSPVTDWIAVDGTTPVHSSHSIPSHQDTPPTPHALITHLELYVRTYSVPYLATAKISKWLGTQSLEALRRLTFISPVETHDYSEVGISLSEVQKDILVRNIGDACPGITIDFRALAQDAEFPVLLTF